MRIDLMEHRDLIRGAAEVEETPEGVRSSRMTAEAVELYRKREDAGFQAEFSAGVRIALVTDSGYLEMRLAPGCAGRIRDYQIDVLVDRAECHTFSPEDPDEEFSFSLDLPTCEEEHEVEILLPITACVEIREFELADGALFRPTYCSDERMLFLGGASTMGMAASSPLRSYAALLAAQLDTDYINWGVGGMPLTAEVGELALELEWQRVLICCDAEDFVVNRNAEETAEQLAALLDHVTSRPGVTVYVMSPLLWHGREETRNGAGSRLEDFRLAIRRVVSSFPGVRLIDGAKMLEDDEDLFAAGRRYPSDEGMALIAEKLSQYFA